MAFDGDTVFENAGFIYENAFVNQFKYKQITKLFNKLTKQIRSLNSVNQTNYWFLRRPI